MKSQNKEMFFKLSDNCIRSLVNKNMELEKIIDQQELRIMQLESALAELYNEIDFSEFQSSEKDEVLKKVIKLLKDSDSRNIFLVGRT